MQGGWCWFHINFLRGMCGSIFSCRSGIRYRSVMVGVWWWHPASISEEVFGHLPNIFIIWFTEPGNGVLEQEMERIVERDPLHCWGFIDFSNQLLGGKKRRTRILSRFCYAHWDVYILASSLNAYKCEIAYKQNWAWVCWFNLLLGFPRKDKVRWDGVNCEKANLEMWFKKFSQKISL